MVNGRPSSCRKVSPSSPRTSIIASACTDTPRLAMSAVMQSSSCLLRRACGVRRQLCGLRRDDGVRLDLDTGVDALEVVHAAASGSVAVDAALEHGSRRVEAGADVVFLNFEVEERVAVGTRRAHRELTGVGVVAVEHDVHARRKLRALELTREAVADAFQRNLVEVGATVGTDVREIFDLDP